MADLQEQMKDFYSSSNLYLNQLKSHNIRVYSKYLDKILTSIKPKSKILDIGSGAGQVANFLQSKDFNVTGVDISPLFIREAKFQASKSKLKTKFWLWILAS
ncbi:MAG: class I SAM-dependent methyltransferase [Candidatus Pacearchaeota archaeon]|nr:class I SAM-dependent methyltransferase [Candidatus Pacearchaeota archaeon]